MNGFYCLDSSVQDLKWLKCEIGIIALVIQSRNKKTSQRVSFCRPHEDSGAKSRVNAPMCSICFCMCMVINVTIIIITIITTTANIIITMHLQSCTVMLLCAAYGHRQGPPCIAWTDRWRKHPDFALQVTRAQFRLHLQPSSF